MKDNKKDKILETIPTNAIVTYLVGAMSNTAKKDGGRGWRQDLTPDLSKIVDVVLDPNVREKEKIGMSTLEFHKHLAGWKKSGWWDKYRKGHNIIWTGLDKYEEDGTLIHLPGDFDFVRNSNFLIAHYEKNDKPCGTYIEVGLAAYLGKPVYLWTDVPKSELQDSFLGMVLISGNNEGKVFKSKNKLLEYLEKKYKKNKR